MLKNKYLKLISIIILISFLSAYYISNSGYYEYRMQERTILTNEKIKEFEQDVKNKENIDIKTYLDTSEIYYYNNMTNLMYKISDNGTKITKKIIKTIFKKLSYLTED